MSPKNPHPHSAPNRRRIAILVVSLAASLFAFGVTGPMALAASTTEAQYCDGVKSSGSDTSCGENDTKGQTAGGTTDPAASAGDNGRVGSLPFTGLDLAAMAGLALILIAAGIALARFNSSRRPQA